MIIQTTIYNHNYTPIFISRIDQDLYTTGGKHDTTTDNDIPDIYSRDIQTINATTFDNQSGMLLKPFQSIRQTSSFAMLDYEKDFNGSLGYVSVLTTDSIDYGEFFIKSFYHEKIMHTINILKIASNLNIFPLYYTDLNDPNIQDHYINIKFDLLDVDHFTEIFEFTKTVGFDGYEILDYKLYADGGVYNVGMLEQCPDKCLECKARGGYVNIGGLTYTIDTVKGIIFEEDSGEIQKVTKVDNNVICQFKVKIKTLLNIYNAVNQNKIAEAKADGGEPEYWEVQLPIGIEALIQFKNKIGLSPYKLNFKIITGIIMWGPCLSNEPGNPEPPALVKVREVFINNAELFDHNELISTPAHLKMLTYPTDYFTGIVNIIGKSFIDLENNGLVNNDSFFKITNIRQDTIDSNVSSGNISVGHEMLPVKRLIQVDSYNHNSHNLTLYIDATNISSKYNNTILLDFEYDDTATGTFGIPVTIQPLLEQVPLLTLHDIVPAYSISFDGYATPMYKYTPPIHSGKYNHHVMVTNTETEAVSFIFENAGGEDVFINNVTIDTPYNFKKEILNKYPLYSELELCNFIGVDKNIVAGLNIVYDDIVTLVFINRLYKEEFGDESDGLVETHLKSMIVPIPNTTDQNYDIKIQEYTDAMAYTKDIIEKCKTEQTKPLDNYFKFSLKSMINHLGNNYCKLNYINLTYELTKVKNPINIQYGKYYMFKFDCQNNNGSHIYSWYCNQPMSQVFYNTEIISKEVNTDLKYVKPDTYNTLYLEFATRIYFDERYPKYNMQPESIFVKSIDIINYDDKDSMISDDEFFINKNQFPQELHPLNTSPFFSKISYDIKLNNERLYKYKVKVNTTSRYIKAFEIVMNVLATTIDTEEIIQFDKSDFFVRNNKYFMSLEYGIHKLRTIKINNLSASTNVTLTGISLVGMDMNWGVTFSVDLSTFTFPYQLLCNTSIYLNVDYLGNAPGHFGTFIVLHTELGDVYLNVATFVNTKMTDVQVMMENRKGTSFRAALNGSDVDFIKLINFGQDYCNIQITKLGYDKQQFLVHNTTKLYPETINYIENIFVPTSTGKKIGWLDIKLRDMLETYNLKGENYTEANEVQDYKIQNSHILAEMIGECFTDHALPYFTRSVVDFGYISLESIKYVNRVDTFTIKNLGLTPFIITKISKANMDSPFSIPLIGLNLPITVVKEITLPINIITSKLNNLTTYTDVFTFEIQDLKSKHIFRHDIIVKVEITENNREYFSFNSEFINFGYCEINHFKLDEIIAKNYSTDRVVLRVNHVGNVEFQSPNNFTMNLWPNQTFSIPVYFYPHGIDNFEGKLLLDFNNGNYIKEINLYGMGVDFNSPLVYVENKMANYFKSLKNELGKPKYI